MIAEILRFSELSVYTEGIFLKTFPQHFELCFYCNPMLVSSSFPSGSFSVNGLCTLQQPYAFRSNSLFMLTCCGAPWHFSVAGLCSDVLRLWFSYCWQALCLWRNWAELAWSLFGDGFWVVADFSRIKCAFRVAFCRLMQDTCGLIWLNCL